ncbi:MAG: YodC family protein [Acidobacteriia bacterium]|nr:YodC family protein [Terriglobia bacterium]
MDHEFKDGDVVQLKSGGPPMTIDTIGRFGMMGSEHDQAKCVWFEGKKRMEGVFELHTLTSASSAGRSGTVSRA